MMCNMSTHMSTHEHIVDLPCYSKWHAVSLISRTCFRQVLRPSETHRTSLASLLLLLSEDLLGVQLPIPPILHEAKRTIS